MLRHIPEVRMSHILRGSGLKSQLDRGLCRISVWIEGKRTGGQLETWCWNIDLNIPGNS